MAEAVDICLAIKLFLHLLQSFIMPLCTASRSGAALCGVAE